MPARSLPVGVNSARAAGEMEAGMCRPRFRKNAIVNRRDSFQYPLEGYTETAQKSGTSTASAVQFVISALVIDVLAIAVDILLAALGRQLFHHRFAGAVLVAAFRCLLAERRFRHEGVNIRRALKDFRRDARATQCFRDLQHL